jgi:cobalamin biosynthesis Mg chelatase CobN
MSSSEGEARDQRQQPGTAGQEAGERTDGGETPDPAELRQDIEETREELGSTVEALAHKADVKAQAQEKLDTAKAQAQEKVDAAKVQAQEKVDAAKSELRHKQDEAKAKVGEVGGQVRNRPLPIAGIVAGLLVCLLVLWLWRRD